MAIVKYFRFLIFGVGLFLIFDIGALIYLNNSYLKDSGSFSVTKISSGVPKNTVKKIAIDNNVSNFRVSHDGNYLSYLKNSTVFVVNLSNGQKYSIPPVNQMRVSAFKWIYDRDRLLIAETTTAGYPYYGKLYYFDMAGRNLVEIRDNYYNKDIKISLWSSSDSITDMDMSAETNLTFLKVTNSSGNSTLWESNIMVSTNSLPYAISRKIGKIACLKMSETLFYEDANSGEVYRYDNKKLISINGNKNFKILGIDQKDNIYLASMKGHEVDSVYYGNTKDNNWSKLTTAQPTDLSQLFFTYQGNVFEDNPSASTIINLSTHKKQSYIGKIAGVFDNGFLSKVNNQVIVNNFNN